jgi:hypothetical protein
MFLHHFDLFEEGTMSRIQAPTLFQAFRLSSGAVVAVVLVMLFFGGVLDASAASSKTSSTTGQTSTGQTTTSSFTDYVPSGYSIEGPLTIVSATTTVITFFSGRSAKPLVLNLQGTRLSVKDQNNNALSSGALTSGVRVYVCRSADKKTIIIFVVPSAGEGKDDV